MIPARAAGLARSGPLRGAAHAKSLAAPRAGDTAAVDLADREHVQREGDQVVAALEQTGVLGT